MNAEANRTWESLFKRLTPLRKKQLHPFFVEGLEYLQMDSDRVPDLNRINKRLQNLTGFKGVFVEGHEAPKSFFPMLARREFPVGNFIRSASDLDYTPAPDVFHDLYGHLPFLTNQKYADFSARFGEVASHYEDNSALLRQFERFYWFTLEFGLVKTNEGIRIFGGGIASSFRECAFSLSNEPTILAFSVESVRSREFKIDELQRTLFLLESPEQLYESLNLFEEKVNLDAKAL